MHPIGTRLYRATLGISLFSCFCLSKVFLRTSIAEVESRTQGSRPRTQKNPRPRPRTAFPRTDTLEAKDRKARGQGQGHKRKCSPKKKSLHKNFSGDLQKNFSSAPQNFNNSKISAVLEPRTGQFSRT